MKYFVYYLYKLDWEKFNKFLSFTSNKTHKSKTALVWDVFVNSIEFNVSILEYFLFGFYEKPKSEKVKWAGTGYMYEYQRVMNPPSKRNILDDKTLFYKAYQEFFVHHVMDLEEIKSNPQKLDKLLEADKLVLKESNGKCGLRTHFIETSNYTTKSFMRLMEEEGYDLAETFIEQHPELNKLSPSGVNTVRIFTQLSANDEVEILGCRQRISVNSKIDNLAAGNIAAPIDEKTGRINGKGIYSDITKDPVEKHPATGVEIIGFQIPLWNQCLELATKAALNHPQNRSIGWDIVVTTNGVGLIEGNHDWCKLVWQLPVNKGLKPILENHLKSYLNR